MYTVEIKTSNTDALLIHYVLQVLRCFFNLGPRALEMLRAPRYLNSALIGYCSMAYAENFHGGGFGSGSYGGHLHLVCTVCDVTI